MDIAARIDPEARDDQGLVHSVTLVLTGATGPPTLITASIAPKFRAAATKIVTAEPEPNNLRILREARGLSQTALARMVGTPQPQLCRWEHGTVQPMARSLYRLADALGVKVSDLRISGYGIEDVKPAVSQAAVQ